MIEGPMAGGHLGFTRQELEHVDEMDYGAKIRRIITLKEMYEDKYGIYIPVFAAGGFFARLIIYGRQRRKRRYKTRSGKASANIAAALWR